MPLADRSRHLHTARFAVPLSHIFKRHQPAGKLCKAVRVDFGWLHCRVKPSDLAEERSNDGPRRRWRALALK
jgi:hypothetical protein